MSDREVILQTSTGETTGPGLAENRAPMPAHAGDTIRIAHHEAGAPYWLSGAPLSVSGPMMQSRHFPRFLQRPLFGVVVVAL